MQLYVISFNRYIFTTEYNDIPRVIF